MNIIDKVFGIDTWFFWKVKWKSKFRRLRCILLGGHQHEWKRLHGGGSGLDALMCKRCRCHVKDYRITVE